jgi:hypothetical protein
MKTMTKKIQAAGAILLGLSVAAVLTLGTMPAGACDKDGKTSAAKVSNESGCSAKGGTATKVSNESGCAAAKQASTDGKTCTMSAKAGSCAAGKAMAGGSCCAAKKASVTTTASTMFPEGTQVTKVAVDGGVDLIFTGRDLAAIEKALSEHAKACNTTDGGKKCANKCSISKTDNGVVMSVRGESPESCCAGMMVTAEEHTTSEKTTVKKS